MSRASTPRSVTVLETVRQRRADIARIASKHGARDVYVFGSVARGDARSDSDIDFLVTMDGGRSLLDLGGLWMDLEALLERKVDVVTRGGLAPRLRDRIEADAVPLL
ncbi:MAG: nucleotidyltransferase [Chloroflexota bacterium]|nr:MAG: nucleotidyltransferase [Chloroflexota bacterium]